MERITQAEFKKALEETKNPMCHLKGFKGAIHGDEGLELWHQVDTEEFEYVSQFIDQDNEVYYLGSR